MLILRANHDYMYAKKNKTKSKAVVVATAVHIKKNAFTHLVNEYSLCVEQSAAKLNISIVTQLSPRIFQML